MGFFDSPVFAILNPVGFVAQKIQDKNGGDANTRVANWFANNPALPGCDGSLTANCDFIGTAADWEAFRRDRINACMSANTGGFGTSKNKTRSACEAGFDELTYDIRQKFGSENIADKDYIKDLVSKDNPMLYVIIFLFVALIVYLLFSKK